MAKDKAEVQELNSTTAGLQDPSFTITRLGKKGAKPRPLLVSYENLENKIKVMRNLYKLKHAKEPLKNISIRQDMSQSEREQEKALQDEAKAQNERQQAEDPRYMITVRGSPWDRHIVKVKKKASRPNTDQGATPEAAPAEVNPEHQNRELDVVDEVFTNANGN